MRSTTSRDSSRETIRYLDGTGVAFLAVAPYSPLRSRQSTSMLAECCASYVANVLEFRSGSWSTSLWCSMPPDGTPAMPAPEGEVVYTQDCSSDTGDERDGPSICSQTNQTQLFRIGKMV
jgi:hypothetical protein